MDDGGYLSSFYFALLSGDAFHAASIADDENTGALGWMLALIAADFPRDCYGSADAVRTWRGLQAGTVEENPRTLLSSSEDVWPVEGGLSEVPDPSSETREPN